MELSPRLYSTFVRPSWFIKNYIDDVISSRFDLKDKVVLDFGCGIGSCSHMFKPEKYIGIDCDNDRINYAKKLHPKYDFHVVLDAKLPIEQNLVDHILIFSALHHISTDEVNKYIKEFYRILKPNGKIFAVEPCLFERSKFRNYVMTTFDRGRYIRNTQEYLNLFSKNSFSTEIVKKYKQIIFYNKLFFIATVK